MRRVPDAPRDGPWWRRWFFSRPDYSRWAADESEPQQPGAPAPPVSERDLLQRIAKDVNTIKTVVIVTFWLSVMVGVLIAFANSSNA